MRIELHAVHKRFGRREALAGIDLEIAHGARVALVGPNGSGKSTLLRVLMGLMACEGSVKLDGRSPFHARSQIAAQLAYVPQVAPAFGATLREIVGAIASLRQIETARVAATARRLGLELEPLRHQPFRALSGGMKQKVLIALALCSEASLYILDEPTASLDADSRERFEALLEDRTRGATLLFCSHRSSELQRHVTRELELLEGRIVRDAPTRAAPAAGSPTSAGLQP